MPPASTVTCRNCRASSPLRELYLPGPAGRLFSGLWCPYCRIHRAWYPGAHLAAWTVVLLAYAAWAPQFGRENSFALTVILVALFWVPVRVATIVLHELSHLLAALLVGYRTWGFKLGTGDVVRRWRLGRWRIEFTANWAIGSGAAYVAPPPGTSSLVRRRAVLLAPYFTHLTVAILAWPSGSGSLHAVGWLLAANQLWYCVWNLWPRVRDTDVSMTDGSALEFERRFPGRARELLEWVAIRHEVQDVWEAGTREDAERALAAAAAEWSGTPQYAALLYALRWPDPEHEPTVDTLAAYSRLWDEMPLVRSCDRFAVGDPAADAGASFALGSWLYYNDHVARLVALLEDRVAASTKPVERAFWSASLAVTALVGEVQPCERYLAAADEASTALPWYDVAQVAAALADLVRDDPKSALRRIETATNYLRPGSSIGIRDGVCALALAHQAQNHSARELWATVGELQPGPVLRRRVERELGLAPADSNPVQGAG